METFSKLNPDVRRMAGVRWYWIDRELLATCGPRLKPSGIAVYNALAAFANFKTQSCFPTQKSIAELLGVGTRTVARKIRLLQELGLVRVGRRKRGCAYYLLQVPKEAGIYDKKDTSQVTGGQTNNTYINKIKNDNGIEGMNFYDGDVFKGFTPQTREELLALDLARGLNDPEGLPFYLSMARKYPESLLRQLLGEVKAVPTEKIRDSRAALFNHLVQKHDQKTTQHPGA